MGNNNDGTISTSELGLVLKALGRPSDADSVSNLIRRFDLDKSGRIDWSNGEFLLVIAMLDVVDVSEIDDFVFTAGFKTFDQDSDSFITPLELHVSSDFFFLWMLQEKMRTLMTSSRRWMLTKMGKLDLRNLLSTSKRQALEIFC